MNEQTETSMTPWCYSQQRCLRMPLTHRSSWSSKRRSTDSIDLMLSISPSARSTWSSRKSSTHNWLKWMCRQKPTRRDRREFCFAKKCPRSGGKSNSKGTKVKSGHFTRSCPPTVLYRADRLWYHWFSRVSRIKSNSSRMRARRRRRREPKAALSWKEVT